MRGKDYTVADRIPAEIRVKERPQCECGCGPKSIYQVRVGFFGKDGKLGRHDLYHGCKERIAIITRNYPVVARQKLVEIR